jgi:hypothetical protein
MQENKRSMSAAGNNKRPKLDNVNSTDEMVIPAGFDINFPPDLEPEIQAAIDPNENPDEPQDPAVSDAQFRLISKVRSLLKNAYIQAPKASHNPFIHKVCPIGWHLLRYDPGNKSLAYVLHVHEGWTKEGMLEIIGGSEVPFCVPPLTIKESRLLWQSLRRIRGLEKLKEKCAMEVDIPFDWLHKKPKAKDFRKIGCTEYAKYMAALTAFNYSLFVGKPDYYIRAVYHDLGMPGVSGNFVDFYLISLCVVCVDPSLIINSTKDIGKWGNNKGKVQKALIKAVKTAKQEDIKYPKTLSLLKTIFPWILN